MSFILDALRKLEQNRKRGEIPDISTMHRQDNAPQKKRALWPYLLLAALLLITGIFTITTWLRPWEEKEIITAQPGIPETEESAKADQLKDITSTEKDITSAEKDNTSTESEIVKVENIIDKEEDIVRPAEDKKTDDKITKITAEPLESTDQEQPIMKSNEEVIASIGLNPTPEELGILRDKIKEEQEITNRVPLEELVEPLEPEIIESEDKSSFIAFSQLPDNIQKELPKITINGHIYSDSRSARVVNINGFITREGDKVAPGLILKEITTAGAIFSYKEYRFQILAF